MRPITLEVPDNVAEAIAAAADGPARAAAILTAAFSPLPTPKRTHGALRLTPEGWAAVEESLAVTVPVNRFDRGSARRRAVEYLVLRGRPAEGLWGDEPAADPPSDWQIEEAAPFRFAREQALQSIDHSRGSDYAARWYDGLLNAIHDLSEPPGPGVGRLYEPEKVRLRAQVRLWTYRGPDRKGSRWVTYYLLYAVFDPERILLLRLIPALGEDASRYFIDPPDA